VARAFAPRDEKAGKVVEDDGEPEDHDVPRRKGHVKNAARCEQEHPAKPAWPRKMKRCSQWKEMRNSKELKSLIAGRRVLSSE
jgi:hypothetical protein